MGGAERKIYELFCAANKKEKSFIVTVDNKLANLYGKTVLNQVFNDRSNGKLKLNKRNSLSLNVRHFIPFTNKWRDIRNKINNSRVIYAKSELLELLILIYFCGFKVLSKVVAGVRSPWLYQTPISNWNRFHNIIYTSIFMKKIMKNTKIVHVLNTRDKKFFEKVFSLKNVVLVPNYIEAQNFTLLTPVKSNLDELRVIFIGELTSRKGINILIKVIESSPINIIFDIVGDGPMKDEIIALSTKYINCNYHGYLERNELLYQINQNDVLFLPSYAEGFGNVILEAMSIGLKIVDSTNISLNLPSYIETSISNLKYKDYIKRFGSILKVKKRNNMNRRKISQFCIDNYNSKKIIPKLLIELFKIQNENKISQVTVGIPTYFAENNIKNLLKSLLNQKGNNFQLTKIIVYYDQSGDNTLKKVKELIDKKIEIVDGKTRQGFAQGVKKIISMNKSDILLLLNDDIKINDREFIFKLIQPFNLESNIGLVCGNPQPLEPISFVDKALSSRLKASEHLSYKVKNGNNIFSCDGKILALSKKFIQNLKLPKNNFEIGNVDAFLYFACITSGFRYFFVRNAYVYYRNPTTLSDYSKWISRNNTQKYILHKNFDVDLINKEYTKPKRLLISTVLKQLIINPVGFLFIFSIEVFNIIKARNLLGNLTSTWEIVETTKNLKNR